MLGLVGVGETSVEAGGGEDVGLEVGEEASWGRFEERLEEAG